jgi:hypothetical protein
MNRRFSLMVRTISRKMTPLALFLIVAMGVLLLLSTTVVHADTVVTNPTLPATFSWPLWWSGSAGTNDCDASFYNANNSAGQTAVLLQTWRGIQVCGPQPNSDLSNEALEPMPNNGTSQWMWQCPELPARYLQVAYGLKSQTAGGGAFAQTYANAFPSVLQNYSNNGNAVYPQEGDVISMASSTDSNGHVGIVSQLSVSPTPGSATITIVDQNGSDGGSFQLSIVNFVVQNASGYSGFDWIHPRVWSTYLTDTTSDKLESVAASSATSVWAAGYQQSGTSKVPVTYYHDSVQWHKYMPPVQGSYTDEELYGIASSSSGDTWTVGSIPYNQTLAYHWNGSSWVHVTSDSPGCSGCSNQLDGVSIDGAGNVWAVGVYYTSGHNKPLIEKWNGTKFAQQTISLPSGETDANLNSVAFSSSSNGWAVGGAGGTVNSYVVYHYDGSSWTPYTLGSLNGAVLSSVTAVSDSEAWAVGKQLVSNVWRPLILHYTSANGWQQDTSFTGYPSGNLALWGVGTDDASNVWAVGDNGFTMHYNGSSWVQVTTPSVSGTVYLTSVAVNSDYAWTAGWYGSPASPVVYIS